MILIKEIMFMSLSCHVYQIMSRLTFYRYAVDKVCLSRNREHQTRWTAINLTINRAKRFVECVPQQKQSVWFCILLGENALNRSTLKLTPFVTTSSPFAKHSSWPCSVWSSLMHLTRIHVPKLVAPWRGQPRQITLVTSFVVLLQSLCGVVPGSWCW